MKSLLSIYATTTCWSELSLITDAGIEGLKNYVNHPTLSPTAHGTIAPLLDEFSAASISKGIAD